MSTTINKSSACIVVVVYRNIRLRTKNIISDDADSNKHK